MIRAAQLPWRTGSAAAVRHARRVPVMLQMTAVECAAACLAMVLTFYGRRTTLAEAREALGVGRDGVTAAVLVAEARRQGLRVKAVVVPPEQFDRLPCQRSCTGSSTTSWLWSAGRTMESTSWIRRAVAEGCRSTSSRRATPVLPWRSNRVALRTSPYDPASGVADVSELAAALAVGTQRTDARPPGVCRAQDAGAGAAAHDRRRR